MPLFGEWKEEYADQPRTLGRGRKETHFLWHKSQALVTLIRAVPPSVRMGPRLPRDEEEGLELTGEEEVAIAVEGASRSGAGGAYGATTSVMRSDALLVGRGYFADFAFRLRRHRFAPAPPLPFGSGGR